MNARREELKCKKNNIKYLNYIWNYYEVCVNVNFGYKTSTKISLTKNEKEGV